MNRVRHISLYDVRIFTQTLKDKFLVDFTEYASTYLRNRLENFIIKWNFSSLESLLVKMQDNDQLLERLIETLSVETTELFRDPSLWRKLASDYFPKFASGLKIWIPDVTSDDELFTLLIVLHSAGLLDKSYVLATSPFKVNIERVKAAKISMKKYEVSNDNFKRFMQDNDASLKNYFVFSDNHAFFSQELIEKADLRVIDALKDAPADNFDFILYRNRMLYQNLNLQNKVLERLYAHLDKKRYLIIGFKENIERFTFYDHFKYADAEDKIYKRVR